MPTAFVCVWRLWCAGDILLTVLLGDCGHTALTSIISRPQPSDDTGRHPSRLHNVRFSRVRGVPWRKQFLYKLANAVSRIRSLCMLNQSTKYKLAHSYCWSSKHLIVTQVKLDLRHFESTSSIMYRYCFHHIQQKGNYLHFTTILRYDKWEMWSY